MKIVQIDHDRKLKIQQEAIILLEESELSRRSSEIQHYYFNWTEDSLLDYFLLKLSNNNWVHPSENALLENDKDTIVEHVHHMTEYIKLIADDHMNRKKESAMITLEESLTHLYYQEKENVSY